MTNLYDRAVLDWANDQLEKTGHPRDAAALRFGEWIGCYSSWTCDYGVDATIERTNGQSVMVAGWGFPDVIEALPQYVTAREEMERKHAAYHGWDESTNDTEVRFS